jgi:hypothetical protein
MRRLHERLECANSQQATDNPRSSTEPVDVAHSPGLNHGLKVNQGTDRTNVEFENGLSSNLH